MAKTYEVEIVASIFKKIEVVADSEDHAEELAHEMFKDQYDGTPTIIEQDTYEIEEIGER
jgi:hypothetical protein